MNMKGLRLVAAIGLLFLFGACENDIAEGFGKGEKVEIFLSTNITNYQAGADVTRNLGLREPESRTIYINDSIYLQTTLVPDAEEELRAAAFKEGQKLGFAAFKADGSGQVGATAVYTYSGGKWTSSNPLGVTPDNSTTYRFVAYSYFDETGTPPTDGSGIDPVHDLVWGMSVDTKIEDETEAARTVDINMLHKFARVKVVVRSEIPTANITALSGVEIEGGQLAGLTLFDGDISWSGSVTQGVADPFTVKSEKERESGYRTVKPVGTAPIKMKVGTVQVSVAATTFYNSIVEFDATLDEATSYTLVVEIKRCNWARSNIYWVKTGEYDNGSGDTGDTGYLTFVPAGNDLTKQGYQGVMFSWGSLVGVSPVGNFSNTTPIYIPSYNPSEATLSTWRSPDISPYSTWTTDYADAAPPATDIPYMHAKDYARSWQTTYGVDNMYVMEPAQNTDLMWQGLRGDICQYIGATTTDNNLKGYRMPKASEFGSVNDWVKVDDANYLATVGYDDGTADFLDASKNTANMVFGYAVNQAIGKLVFPPGGCRYFNGGSVLYVGERGYVIGGSAGDGNLGFGCGMGLYYWLEYKNTYIWISTGPGGQHYANPVRCVQNLN
jgi:hypothetical protein